MKPLLTGLAIVIALVAYGCTGPAQPSNHPGSPPANNDLATSPTASNPHVPGNVAPKKYGVPALIEYARNQAAETRPGAELVINEDQFRMAPTTGQPKTKPEKSPLDPNSKTHNVNEDLPKYPQG